MLDRPDWPYHHITFANVDILDTGHRSKLGHKRLTHTYDEDKSGQEEEAIDCITEFIVM